MKKYTILFALLLVAIFGSNRAMAVELDTLWSIDYIGEISFQHPITKNIVIEDVKKLVELDSKDGKIIRELPFTNDWGNVPYISKDGTKLLHTNVDDSYIYEYPSMELIIKLKNSRLTKFTNNSEIIMETSTDKDYSTLAKYNFITKEKTFFDPVGNIQDIATSPDGRFIAISTNAIVGSNENWTKLILVDATTMEQIALLEEVKNTGNNFVRMSFSNDGKYLASNSTTFSNDFQRNIYSTETLKVVKNFNPENIETRYPEIKFLNENLYCLTLKQLVQGQKSIFKTIIFDINTNNIILTINDTYSLKFNEELNHLYYSDYKNKKIICLNLTNLITGVSTKPISSVVIYQNKQLKINKENVKQIEISDISGRVLLNQIIENPFSNNTLLSINLINGQYLINVITDKESFTQKLLVME